jgi:phosphoribosylaminoimidazole carboxylase (NCAIR synthetase)
MSRKNKDGIYVNYDKINCSRYEFETTADGVKAYVDSVVADAIAKGMIGEGIFDFAMNRGYYNDDYELVITYDFERVETEKEKATREAVEAKVKAEAAAKRKEKADAKKLKADAEYAEFLRLKEKFGAIEK